MQQIAVRRDQQICATSDRRGKDAPISGIAHLHRCRSVWLGKNFTIAQQLLDGGTLSRNGLRDVLVGQVSPRLRKRQDTPPQLLEPKKLQLPAQGMSHQIAACAAGLSAEPVEQAFQFRLKPDRHGLLDCQTTYHKRKILPTAARPRVAPDGCRSRRRAIAGEPRPVRQSSIQDVEHGSHSLA